MTFQDLGRPGYMAQGLSQGGAADRHALIEGAALLDQPMVPAALEMAGFGGSFEALAPCRIALTGAPMRATLDAKPLLWNASHWVEAGQMLEIGVAQAGIYGYLHLGGGVDAPEFLGSRSAHLVAKISQNLQAGDMLMAGADENLDAAAQKLTPSPRFDGGTLRVLPSVHTELFSPETLERFQQTSFTRTPKGNRQGAELAFDGAPFASAQQLTGLSQPMMAGDIQMTGAGAPFVLLPECQTTGGYPRIATVVPGDLAKVAQASPGISLRFEFVDYDAAIASHRSDQQLYAQTRNAIEPLVRDPHEMSDLLNYQLISGAIAGDE